MPSINKACIMGHVGKDPEVIEFKNGSKIAKLSLATSNRWNDKKSGECKETTQWHNIVVRSPNQIDYLEKYIGKGDLLYLEGEIEYRQWNDREGNTRYATDIVISGYSGKIVSLSQKKVAAEVPKDYTINELNDSIQF